MFTFTRGEFQALDDATNGLCVSQQGRLVDLQDNIDSAVVGGFQDLLHTSNKTILGFGFEIIGMRPPIPAWVEAGGANARAGHA